MKLIRHFKHNCMKHRCKHMLSGMFPCSHREFKIYKTTGLFSRITSFGTFASGLFVIGTFVVGRMILGMLFIGKAKISNLDINDLHVHRLRVDKKL